MEARVIYEIWRQHKENRSYRFISVAPTEPGERHQVLVTELEFQFKDGVPTDLRGAVQVESSTQFLTIGEAEDEARVSYKRHIDQGWCDTTSK
jgi:hypothetical protein